ncbi:putative toxin-antitoxin system toxin component, PIN family [Paenibacillus sp. FSL H7-0940]|uniref:putative toxin-antitoxin system toxin component, PIN family n=1 Tax=Paenibacillus TaxID=44249 RepID=UPI0030EC00BB
MIRCVVDTNIFINAIFSDGFKNDEQVLDYEQNGSIKFVFSNYTANELWTIFSRTIGEKRIFESEEFFRELYLTINRSARIDVPPKLQKLSSDKSDQPFIELAVAAQANYFITNDLSNGLIDLGEYQGVKIVKPAQFIRELRRINRRAN